MHKEYPYLQDSYVYHTDTERQKRLLLKDIEQQVNQKQYVKITLLDWEENPIKAIEGEISSGSISKVADSPVRRTASLSCAVDAHSYSVEDGKADFAINKKVFIEIGVKNETPHYPEYPIFWFPEGVFFITSFSINSSSSSALNISISLKDKMAMLNGDVGGTLPTTVIFDSMDTQLPSGAYIEKKVLIYNIIKELVNHYGGESLTRIVIEGVPLRIRRIMKWVGNSALYLYMRNPENTSGEGNEPVIFGSGLPESYIYTLQLDDSLGNLVNTFSKGDDVGYIMDDFVITGELTGAPGESVTSILDKIKNILGNYEYFYDVFGTFHFREIKNYYVTTQARTLLDEMAENDYLVETNNERSIFTFDDINLLTSINVTPQYENIKNDYIVEGHTENESGISYNVRYHLAIDKKPRPIGKDNRTIIYQLNNNDEVIAEKQTQLAIQKNQLYLSEDKLKQVQFLIDRGYNIIKQRETHYQGQDKLLFDLLRRTFKTELQRTDTTETNIIAVIDNPRIEDLQKQYQESLDTYGWSSTLMWVYNGEQWGEQHRLGTQENDINIVTAWVDKNYAQELQAITNKLNEISNSVQEYQKEIDELNYLLGNVTPSYDWTNFAPLDDPDRNVKIETARAGLTEDLRNYSITLNSLKLQQEFYENRPADIKNYWDVNDEDVHSGEGYEYYINLITSLINDVAYINDRKLMLYGHHYDLNIDEPYSIIEGEQEYFYYQYYKTPIDVAEDEVIESLYYQKYNSVIPTEIDDINTEITGLENDIIKLENTNHKKFISKENINKNRDYYESYPSSSDIFIVNNYNYTQEQMEEYNTNIAAIYEEEGIDTTVPILENLTKTNFPATLIFYHHPRNGAITAAYVANVSKLPDIGNFNLIYQEIGENTQSPTIENIENYVLNDFKYWNGSVYQIITPIAVYIQGIEELEYRATDWRTKLYLDGLRGVLNGTDKGYYYEELAAFWPQVYNLQEQCFYGQQDDNTVQFKTLCAGTYYLDFLDSLATSFGEWSVDNIGRRTNMVVNDEINCLFQPEIPNIILLPTTSGLINDDSYNALEKEKSLYELKKEAQDNYYPWTQVSDEIYNNLLTGGYRNAAFDQIKYELYLHTRYQKSISMTSIPVFYLEPNSRITIDDPVSHTYGDFIVQSINLTLGPGANMSITCNETAERF